VEEARNQWQGILDLSVGYAAAKGKNYSSRRAVYVSEVRIRAPQLSPGQHGKDAQFRRGRGSDYSLQLREKQKARRIYGILERQFRAISMTRCVAPA